MNNNNINNIKNYDSSQSQNKRYSRSRRILAILHIYSVFGLLLAISGFTYFLLLRFDISLTTAESYALLISVSGIFIFIMSYMSGVIIKNKNIIFYDRYNINSNQMRFVNEWIKFENNARSIVNSSCRNEQNSNVYSIKSLLNCLINLNQITTNQADQLGHILTLRNKIVHGINNITNNEIYDALIFLDKINKQLNKNEI